MLCAQLPKSKTSRDDKWRKEEDEMKENVKKIKERGRTKRRINEEITGVEEQLEELKGGILLLTLKV